MIDTGIILALNEKDYIVPAVQSLVPICRKIVAIEACTSLCYDFLREGGQVTEKGLSTDGTTEILSSMPEVTSHLRYGVWEGTLEWLIQQVGLDLTPPGHYFCFITGNEIILPETQEATLRVVDEGIPSQIGWAPIVLWKNFNHRIIGKGWDTHTIWRVEHRHEDSKTLDDRFTYLQNINQGLYRDPEIKMQNGFLKLAYARDPERVFWKIAWQEVYFHDRLNNLGSYPSIRDYIYRTNSWFTNQQDAGISVVPWHGYIPPNVKQPDGLLEGEIDEWNDV